MATAYAAVLLFHSWFRYVVLGLGLWLLIACVLGLRGRGAWSGRDERSQVGFLAALDTQMLLGLVLYFVLSPLTAAAISDFGAAMKNPHLRFFGVEHISAMLLGVIVAHVGRVRARRKQGGARYRTTLVTQALWLVLTLAGIPWPMLDVGRPLFRW